MTASQNGGTVYRFGRCEFRPDAQLLLVDDAPVSIDPTPFRVLLTLIRQAGEIVSRNALLDAVWGDKVVEENNVSVQISALRKALGPERDTIRTFPGMGYRFSADLKGAPPVPMAAAGDADRREGNLPESLPALIGRAKEIDNVIDGMQAHRLVTICGTGGMGKTCLALAVASRMRDEFPDGVWVIELASIPPAKLRRWSLPRQVKEICALVAQTLELKLARTGAPEKELAQALVARRLLLVLDNCEHLHEAANAAALALLDGTPEVRLLATSQKLLEVAKEHEFPLGSLLFPDPADLAPETYAAIQLLAIRVREVQPSFTLTEENMRHACELCKKLDGMPLAIELAAARVPFLGLSKLCERLEQRLEMLVKGANGASTRQQTLLATLTWSHDLLSAGAQAVFRRCGVFQGSFGLDEAESVLAAEGEDRWQAIEHLATLVERSLVVVARGEQPRYSMLESTRTFAEKMLKQSRESDTTSARHARTFCALFEQSLDEEWTLRSQDRIERYMPELDNVRAALKWSARHAPLLYVRMAGATAWLLDAAGQSVEGGMHCREALGLLDEVDAPALARARLGEAIALVNHSGNDRQALAGAWLAVRNRKAIGDPKGLYLALGRFGIAAALYGKPWLGRRAVNCMETIHRRTWAALSRWDVMNADDYVSNQLGKIDRAARLADRQLTWAKAHEDKHKIMFAMLARQQCAATRGEHRKSIALAARLVETADKHRYVKSRHIYIYNLAVALTLGNFVRKALPWARIASDEDRRHDSLHQELDLLSTLAALRGRHAAAAAIVGRSEAARKRGQRREPVEQCLYDKVLADLRRQPDWAALDEWRIKGVALELEDAVELALGNDATHAVHFSEVKSKLERDAENRDFTARAVRAWKLARKLAVAEETT